MGDDDDDDDEEEEEEETSVPTGPSGGKTGKQLALELLPQVLAALNPSTSARTSPTALPAPPTVPPSASSCKPDLDSGKLRIIKQWAPRTAQV